MITTIIRELLVSVGFDPNYVMFGSLMEVNQLIDAKPLQAPGVENPDAIDILAAVDVTFTGSDAISPYNMAYNTFAVDILMARKNPGSIDVLQEERVERAYGMLPYASRFTMAINSDPRTKMVSGYVSQNSWRFMYRVFDTDVDGVLLTVSIPITQPINNC
jgi:hypothetical protein